MTIRIDEITADNWSPRVGSPGEIVCGLDDINQCIDIIIATRKGTVPHRPLFGCDAWRWLDAPPAISIPNIKREVLDALDLWEPRIVVVLVTVLLSGSAATVTINWRLVNDATIMKREVLLAA